MVRIMNVRKRKFEQNGRVWTLSSYYNSINIAKKQYINRLSHYNQKQLKVISAGFAPINEANAICMRTLVGELIITSEMLQYFYYFMTLALYGTAEDIPLRDRISAAIIAIRIMNVAEASDFDIDPRGNLPPELDRQIRNRTNDQMEFTFGHEFAHYLKGRQGAHVANVVVARLLAEAAYPHVLDHARPQRADGPVGRMGGHRESSRAEGC